MVLVEKTYSGARRIWSKLLTTTMIVVGFLAILFNARSGLPGMDASVHQAGVAHADVVGVSCDTYNCTEGSDTGGDADGGGCGDE